MVPLIANDIPERIPANVTCKIYVYVTVNAYLQQFGILTSTSLSVCLIGVHMSVAFALNVYITFAIAMVMVLCWTYLFISSLSYQCMYAIFAMCLV